MNVHAGRAQHIQTCHPVERAFESSSTLRKMPVVRQLARIRNKNRTTAPPPDRLAEVIQIANRSVPVCYMVAESVTSSPGITPCRPLDLDVAARRWWQRVRLLCFESRERISKVDFSNYTRQPFPVLLTWWWMGKGLVFQCTCQSTTEAGKRERAL